MGSEPMEALALRRPIFAELVAGISLTGLMIPEGIAYSAIAGLPPSFGVSAAVIGPLGYAIIGRSRLAVVTATSGAAALLAASIANAAIPGVARADCALALTLLVGLFFLLGAIFRLSALTSFVSRAVLQGFGLGLAITERAVPYMALAKRVSSTGLTITFWSSITMLTTGEKVLATWAGTAK